MLIMNPCDVLDLEIALLLGRCSRKIWILLSNKPLICRISLFRCRAREPQNKAVINQASKASRHKRRPNTDELSLSKSIVLHYRGHWSASIVIHSCTSQTSVRPLSKHMHRHRPIYALTEQALHPHKLCRSVKWD